MPAPAEPRCPICMELVPLDELECPNDDCRSGGARSTPRTLWIRREKMPEPTNPIREAIEDYVARCKTEIGRAALALLDKSYRIWRNDEGVCDSDNTGAKEYLVVPLEEKP